MDPIQQLVAEHRVIERVLDALAAYGAAVERGDPVEQARVAEFVTFIRGYADAIHHGEEERIVFAAIQQHGVSPELGPPLAALMRDHETARLLTSDLAVLGNRAGPWSEQDRASLVRSAHSYVSLLRRHIREEDDVVFPAIAATMPGKLLRRVSSAFKKFEKRAAARRSELEALAGRLCAEL